LVTLGLSAHLWTQESIFPFVKYTFGYKITQKGFASLRSLDFSGDPPGNRTPNLLIKSRIFSTYLVWAVTEYLDFTGSFNALWLSLLTVIVHFGNGFGNGQS